MKYRIKDKSDGRFVWTDPNTGGYLFMPSGTSANEYESFRDAHYARQRVLDNCRSRFGTEGDSVFVIVDANNKEVLS